MKVALWICCVFQPAFWCCAHSKAGQNTFFQPFSTFFVHFKPFSVISRLKSTKNIWKWTKKKRCFVYSSKSKMVDMQKLVPERVPRNCLFSVDFLLFLTKIQLKKKQIRGTNNTKLEKKFHCHSLQWYHCLLFLGKLVPSRQPDDEPEGGAELLVPEHVGRAETSKKLFVSGRRRL